MYVGTKFSCTFVLLCAPANYDNTSPMPMHLIQSTCLAYFARHKQYVATCHFPYTTKSKLSTQDISNNASRLVLWWAVYLAHDNLLSPHICHQDVWDHNKSANNFTHFPKCFLLYLYWARDPLVAFSTWHIANAALPDFCLAEPIHAYAKKNKVGGRVKLWSSSTTKIMLLGHCHWNLLTFVMLMSTSWSLAIICLHKSK